MPTTYIAAIGLEIHAQLITASKMFSPEATSYEALPNTQTSAVTLAHPGTLPTINKRAIDLAIQMGLACNAKITEYNCFARKNYHYPDLPKGFQITQDKTPICQGGYITIDSPKAKKIHLTRIHLEEDTGKSLHDLMPGLTLLDFNRAGTPLIEIVTTPEIRSPEEAYACLKEIRRLMRYLGVCDGNMEAGSLRCDVNVSLRKEDDNKLGQKVEVKNINSMRYIQLAIADEIARQVALLNKGIGITATTRAYDAQRGRTIHMRDKETLAEYRYFPEPNLSPFIVDASWITQVKASMPLLPRQLLEKFITTYGLTTYDANVLVEDKGIALLFEAICKHTIHYKTAANWVMGPVKSLLNKHKLVVDSLPIAAVDMGTIVEMIASSKLSFSVAADSLLPTLLAKPSVAPDLLAEELGVLQTADKALLLTWVKAAIATYPDKVQAYRGGAKGIINLFIGEVMKHSKGRANPSKIRRLLEQQLG